MSRQDNNELFRMVSEIYHHLGLDGKKPASINKIREEAEKDVLKFKEKQSKKRYGFEETASR